MKIEQLVHLPDFPKIKDMWVWVSLSAYHLSLSLICALPYCHLMITRVMMKNGAKMKKMKENKSQNQW